MEQEKTERTERAGASKSALDYSQKLSLFGDSSRRFENLATAKAIPLFPPFSPVDC